MTTLGKTTDGGSTSTSSTDKAVCSLHTASADGILATGTGRIWVDSGSATAAMAVWAYSGGSPGALLAISAYENLTNSETAEEFTFSGANNIAIANGTQYFVGFTWADPGSANITWSRDATASQTQQVNTQAPNPFGTPGSALSGPIDAYVEFFPAATADDGAFFEFF